MTIKVLLINENGANYIDIENDYKSFNNALKWDDYWNTPTISVMGKKYIAICSDTGKLRHESISALSKVNFIAPKETIRETFLVGAIIITKFDGTDDFETLNEKDIDTLNNRLFSFLQNKTKEGIMPTILMLDY